VLAELGECRRLRFWAWWKGARAERARLRRRTRRKTSLKVRTASERACLVRTRVRALNVDLARRPGRSVESESGQCACQCLVSALPCPRAFHRLYRSSGDVDVSMMCVPKACPSAHFKAHSFLRARPRPDVGVRFPHRMIQITCKSGVRGCNCRSAEKAWICIERRLQVRYKARTARSAGAPKRP
jgi:hypothetical protein